MLERGPWRDTLPVRSMGIKNRAKFPQARKFFTNILRSAHAPLLPRDGVRINARGMYEFFVNKGITNICTSSVGGGSHAYSGLNQRPIVENYWDGHAEDVSSDGMETYYQAVMAKPGSHHRLPEDKVPNTTTELFASSDVFSDVNGYDAPAFGLLFPKEPSHPKKVVTEDGIERMESAYDDDSFLGSAGGVKSSLDFIYLAGAIKKGLTVRDLRELTRIERVGEGNEALYRVEVMDHQAICPKSFYARKVIVAASAMNTLKLLFHSLYTGGLSGMPRLGRGIGSNGDYGGYWSLDQEGANFTRGMTIHDPIGVKRIKKSYLVLGGVVGLQHVPLLPKKLRRRIGRDAFLGGMGPDTCDDIATYHQGRLSITYNASNSPIFDDIRRALEIAGKASGKRVRYLETPFTCIPVAALAWARISIMALSMPMARYLITRGFLSPMPPLCLRLLAVRHP